MTAIAPADWAAARSDKWRRQLAGLEAMLAPLDAPLIDALRLNTAVVAGTTSPLAPLRIADVGCGAGRTTIEALRHAPATSVAHGFDLSPALIEVARGRRSGYGGDLTFEVADMSTLAPPDHPYHRLVSRLGVMFFREPQAAFLNLRRWLEPTGWFAFAVWGPVDDNPWMTATRAAVADVVEVPAIDPSAPGPFRYADAASLVSQLTGAGFADVTVNDVRLSLPLGDGLGAADAARFALDAFSSFAELLMDAGGDATTRAHRALTTRLRPYEQQNAVYMPACVHIVTGRPDGRWMRSQR